MQRYTFFCIYANFFVPLRRIMDEKQHIGRLFDRIAATYDGLNHGLSLNIDRRWRRKTEAQMLPVEHVLDVAIGTADLTIEMLKKGKAHRVTGLDLSREMMAYGREKVERLKMKEKVDFIYGNAQAMPFENNSFDAVTCAYGCRNFSDLDAGLKEMYRVLKPGGQVVILEFSYPENKIIRWCYDLYFTHILPTIGGWVSKDKKAYTYLNTSVKHFCWGEAFAQHLREAGFSEPQFTPLTFGISTIYTAIKW